MHPPPTDLNVTNPAKNQSQFWWRPFFFFFFFFFFGDHLNLGEKNVWISDFGRKITLNFGEDIRIFEVLCFKSPPNQNFLDPPLLVLATHLLKNPFAPVTLSLPVLQNAFDWLFSLLAIKLSVETTSTLFYCRGNKRVGKLIHLSISKIWILWVWVIQKNIAKNKNSIQT